MMQLIESLGLSDAEIAVKMCVSPQSVYRWRLGRKIPTPIARKALAKIAGVSVDGVAWERKLGNDEKPDSLRIS